MIMIAFRVSREPPLSLLVYFDVHKFTHCFPYLQRPFDLGDRISIVDCTGAPDNSDDPGYHDTWIVEDCNLFTTTLRLSRTNEGEF